MPGHIIRIVALYEAKTLWRSWFFRIFSGLTLLIVVLLDILLFATPFSQWMIRGLPGSIPYMNLVLLTVAQAIIGAFIAPEFLKSDRSLDTTEAVYARSMTNAEYVVGKSLGVLSVFVILNLIVLAISFVFQYFFTEVAVVPAVYLLYPLMLSIPTLVFIFGLSFLIMSVVRSQAVTFAILLGYIAATLFFLGGRLYGLFDYMGLRTPLMYSDFVGFGGAADALILRGMYLSLGLGCIFTTVLLIRRLVQSRLVWILSAALAAAFILGGFALGGVRVAGRMKASDIRTAVSDLNRRIVKEPPISLVRCDLDVKHDGGGIEAAARLTLTNPGGSPVERYRFTLNPGLRVLGVTRGGAALPFDRELHTIVVRPPTPLAPGETDSLTVRYRGDIDERVCYADLSEETHDQNFRFWLFEIRKRYGFVNPRYVLLTSECMWYPDTGIPYGSVFPEMGRKDFIFFTLRVVPGPGLTAVSQGAVQTPRPGEFLYTPEKPLPRISLAIGNYERRTITAEGIEYNLWILRGHDFFKKFFTKISQALPGLLDTTMADYERTVQVSYPFSRFGAVEVPVQFCAYPRIGRGDTETAQPEQVFLPEKGVLLPRNADFKMMSYFMKRGGGRSGQTQTEEEIQSNMFRSFVQGTFVQAQVNFQAVRRAMGGGPRGGGGQGGGLGNVQRLAFSLGAGASIQMNYSIFPQFYSFANMIRSDRYPVLDSAIEQYLRNRSSRNVRAFMRMMMGVTDAEKANLELADASLADILSNPEKRTIAPEALSNKGSYLITSIAGMAGQKAFSEFLSDYLFEHQFKPVSDTEFAEAIRAKFNIDILPMLETWYLRKGVPAYVLSNPSLKEVVDFDRTRYQLLFTLTNTGSVEGTVTANFLLGGTRGERGAMSRSGGGGGGGGGGGRGGGGGGGGGGREGGGFMMMGAPQDDSNTRWITIAPGQSKEVGALFDTPVRTLTIDTFISRNLPSSFSKNFDKVDKGEGPVYEGQRIVDGRLLTKDEGLIVDNEDPGFSTISGMKVSLLKKLLQRPDPEDTERYISLRVWNPPTVWRPSIRTEFYGAERHSAHYISAGKGLAKAVWKVRIPESGNYDIYAYCPASRLAFMGGRGGGGDRGGRGGGPGQQQGRQQGRQQGQQNATVDDQRYIVHHDDGADEVDVDMKSAEEDWTLLGTYYLSAGEAEVELTNKTKGKIVIADAVKWVKRSETVQRKTQ